MSFILSENRQDCREMTAAFIKYRDYISALRGRISKSAFDLASSEWYYDPSDHRCPHDSWLESLELLEHYGAESKEPRHLKLIVRLLGAYHDGHICLFYDDVKSYSFGFSGAASRNALNRGNGDWLYDEFRLSQNGFLLHEIEWENSRWLIEATDVSLEWRPHGNPT
jgi:hypothetical protein